MDKTLHKLIAALLFLLFVKVAVQAQSWRPLGPDDNNEAFSGLINYNNIVTSPDGVPYIVSSDANNSGKLTVKKFDGNSWATVGSSGFSGGTTGLIALAINGITPYVAFSDVSNSGKATVMKFDGSSWVTVGAAGFSTGSASNISLAFNGNTPYVAYAGTVQRFDGSSWVMVGGVSGLSTGSASGLVLSFDNDIPYVAYLDYSINGTKAYVKKFVGSNWITVGTPGILAGQVSFVAFVFYGNTPFVAYTDANNNYKASVKRFDGNNWATLGNPNISTNTAAYISVAANGTPYVAYEDGGLGGKATVKKFDGQRWVTVGVEGFSAGPADYTSIALSGSTPYVSFKNNDTKKGTAMMFNGSNWVTVGSSGNFAGTGTNLFPSLTTNNNIPYYAYSDGSNGGKATVKKFEENNWVTVGTAGFSPGPVGYTSIDFNGNTPYVAYADFVNGYNNGNATVKKFDGTNWVTVGAPNFSPGAVFYNSLKINNEVPYLAYSDGTNSSKATVKKFDGTNWVTVGAAGFSEALAKYTMLAFNGNTPYVVYSDGLISGSYVSQAEATVKKFDGANWVSVGNTRFSLAPINYPSIAFDGNTPYVAYQEDFTNGKAVVKKFDGNGWVTVGTPSFSSATSSGSPGSVSMVLVGGTPCVVYQDGANGGKASVKKFDGTNWVNVGTPGFSATAVGSPLMSSGTNKIFVAYTSLDGSGTYVKYFDMPLLKNAQLSNLTLSSGTLSPAFASGATSYTAAVPNAISSITLKPTVNDATASVMVNGAAVTSGSASAAIPLTIGSNTITTVVTAQDGTTTQIYTLTVNRAQALQTITFAALPAKTYGDADFAPGATSDNNSTALTYTSNNPAVATILDGKAHIVSAGTATITASQAADATYSAATSVSQNFIVVKTALAITAENKSRTYGADNPLLTVTYQGFVNGDTQDTGLTTLPAVATTATATSSAGNYPITVTGAASNNYTITYLPGTLTVKQASQTITFGTLPTKTYGDADFMLTATASSGLAVTYASSDVTVATVDATGIVYLLAAGTTTITASQPGNSNYNTATPVTQTLTVKQASQAITFASIPNKTYGDADFSLSATTASGLPIIYTTSSTNVATVSTEGKVHVLSAGTTTITASQAGKANYLPINATQNLTVVKAALTIRADDKTRTYGEANPALTVTYSGFANAETQDVFTAMPVIATAATATTDAGTYPITITSAAAANYNITYVPGTLTIIKVAQTITFGALPAKANSDADFTPGAVASSGLPIIYASSNSSIITVVNGQLHMVAPGTATITATQNGNVNYLAAASVSQNAQVVFSLPTKNFTISATGESCKNSNNGEINITAASNQDYTATVVVAGVNTTYPFNKQLSIKNLPAGIYPVCITIADYLAYKQCFDVTITEPKDLAVSSIVNSTNGTLSLNLTGANSYNINLNSNNYTTTQSTIALPLEHGKNTLKVSTNSICQGIYEKTIELPAGITAYPNPFESTLFVVIGGNDHSQKATAEVYNMQGNVVFKGKTNVNQGKCAFGLPPNLIQGTYVLKLVLDHSETRIKIIKK